MEVIDFIDLTAIEPEHVTKAVTDYIESRKEILSTLDTQVRISICKSSSSIRAGKEDRTSILAQLISVHGKSLWEKGPYKFDFVASTFYEDRGDTGKYLHITKGEAVALYQRLVRKQHSDDWPAYYANMKKRHGENFLKEYI